MIDGDRPLTSMRVVVIVELGRKPLAKLSRADHIDDVIVGKGRLDLLEEQVDVRDAVPLRLVPSPAATSPPDHGVVANVIGATFVNGDLGFDQRFDDAVPPSQDPGTLGVDPDQGEAIGSY